MAQSDEGREAETESKSLSFVMGQNEAERLDKIINMKQINDELPMIWTRADLFRRLTREWMAEHEDVLDDDIETEVRAGPPVKR